MATKTLRIIDFSHFFGRFCFIICFTKENDFRPRKFEKNEPPKMVLKRLKRHYIRCYEKIQVPISKNQNHIQQCTFENTKIKIGLPCVNLSKWVGYRGLGVVGRANLKKGVLRIEIRYVLDIKKWLIYQVETTYLSKCPTPTDLPVCVLTQKLGKTEKLWKKGFKQCLEIINMMILVKNRTIYQSIF